MEASGSLYGTDSQNYAHFVELVRIHSSIFVPLVNQQLVYSQRLSCNIQPKFAFSFSGLMELSYRKRHLSLTNYTDRPLRGKKTKLTS